MGLELDPENVLLGRQMSTECMEELTGYVERTQEKKPSIPEVAEKIQGMRSNKEYLGVSMAAVVCCEGLFYFPLQGHITAMERLRIFRRIMRQYVISMKSQELPLLWRKGLWHHMEVLIWCGISKPEVMTSHNNTYKGLNTNERHSDVEEETGWSGI